jgi:alpha-beta hydrolase superfamily lysophospholipase
LQDKFAAPEILRLAEARHHLANESPALRQRYFDFLRERLA